MNKILQGDCIEKMKELEDNSIDTIITDPPYGLEFMGKEWDKPKAMAGQKAHNENMKGALAYGGTHTRGYAAVDMTLFQKWTEQWAKEALRVAKPGATLLSFGGTRTYHRMACAIEDAGWIIKDCIMWLYGSGFPKATDISKQLDKGHKRKVLGYDKNSAPDLRDVGKKSKEAIGIDKLSFGQVQNAKRKIVEITEPITPEAKLWNGWKSHGLKPAYEPIIVAMKPNDGTYANNALKWGVSGLNIDGGRIGTEKRKNNFNDFSNQHGNKFGNGEEIKKLGDTEVIGRFPANIILDEEAAKILDEQSGESGSGKMKKGSYRHKAPNNLYQLGMAKKEGALQNAPDDYGDKGGASRFFYVAKASKKERNMGKMFYWEDGKEIDKELYFKLEKENEGLIEGKKHKISKGNIHPTCKPLKLMEYLCLLTKTPTGGVVLDPFMGSGTTGMACVKTGRDFIGIEKEEEYVKIAKARIEAVQKEKKQHLF